MAKLTIDTDQMTDVGDNIKVKKEGDVMIFVVDATQDLGPSSSGKMNTIASSGGFTAIPGNLKLNLYLGKKA